MKITLKQLEIFVAIAKTGNVSQASELIFLTQSACSMSLFKLEEQLDGPLFDRCGKKLILNERGRILFPKAENIIAAINETQHLMRAKEGGIISGRLAIGASTTIGNYLAPKIVTKFLNKFPNTKIELRVENTETIIEDLLKFRVDVGIIEGDCYHPEIKVSPWKKDELVIIASAQSPLSKKIKLTQEDLYDARWILREMGSGTRSKFEEFFNKKIIPFIELGNTEVIKQAVRNNLGVSCISRIAIEDSLKSKEIVCLKAPFLKLSRDFLILIHRDKYKTHLLDQFMSMLLTS